MHLVLLLFIRNLHLILLFVFILLIFNSLHSNILNIIFFICIIRKVVHLIAAEDFGALLLHIWRIIIRLLNNEFLEQLVTGPLLRFPSQCIFVIFLHNCLHVKNGAVQTDVVFILLNLECIVLHEFMGSVSYGLRIRA